MSGFKTKTLYDSTSNSTNESISAISSSGTDIYYLRSASAVATLSKINSAGTITDLLTFNSSTTPAYNGLGDMIVAGNYLFIIGTVAVSSLKYIYRYAIVGNTLFTPAESLSYGLITLGKFATNYGYTTSGFTIYANTTNRKLIYFVGDGGTFSLTALTTTSAFGASAYVGITYRQTTISSTTYSYLYGVYGTASYSSLTLTRSGKIDEINISNLSSIIVTNSDIPTETLSPNLIKWIDSTQSFYITDKFNNGGYTVDGSNSPYNGKIVKYFPTFNTETGVVTIYRPGTTIMHGSGTTGRYYMHDGMISDAYNLDGSGLPIEDTSQCLSGINSIGYNISPTGYINLYAGNGSTGQNGHLLKFYDSSRTDGGASVGGDPHLRTLDGKLYNLPNDHVHFQLFKCDKLTINCSTKFITKDNYPLEHMLFYSKVKKNVRYIPKKLKELEDDHQIFEYTIIDKIYINCNKHEILIDMKDLSIVSVGAASTASMANIVNNDIFSIDNTQYDHGIFSTRKKGYNIKTDYTKHLSVKCNINNNMHVILNLGSDISINDINDFSIKIHGIDPDSFRGCFVSENDVIKLDSLTSL